MQAPGTPAIVLPKYTPPAFTNPTVELGKVVANISVVSTSQINQTNVPFSCGHVFKQGQLAPLDTLVGLQMNVKATHKDGSVRHAIISGVVASLVAGASVDIPLVRAISKPQTNPSPVPTVPAKITITVAGVTYTATETNDTTHFSGFLAVDQLSSNVPFKDVNGVAHTDLTAQFSHRAYANSPSERIDFTVEHTKAYTATSDITYDVQITVGTEVKYSKLGLVHTPCARWRKVFWSGVAPSVHVKHDTKYLIDSKALPNWDYSLTISETALAGYVDILRVNSFEPMASGCWQYAMATTGGRPDIGLAPSIYVAAVLSMDKRAKDCMLAQADAAASWMSHRRDDTGRILDVVHYSRATILGTIGDSRNPLTGLYEKLPDWKTSSQMSHDSSHQPAVAYIPYLLTGDYYYLEELQFWCNYNTYVSNPYYRSFEKGLVAPDQTRGQGWSIRTLAEAEYITPDNHPSKPIYVHLMNSNMEFYRAQFTDGSNNELGAVTCGTCIEYPINGVPAVGLAPWMDDFFTQAVGHAAELGNAEAARLLKWKAKFQIGRMVGKGYPYVYAAAYSLRVRDTATVVDSTGKTMQAPYYTTLEQCLKGSLGPDSVTPTDMLGYPESTEGFPSNLQPALAMAVDSGYEGGQAAWTLFSNRKTKPNYSLSPQFAIVPRTQVVALPPVVVTPPVIVPPVATPPSYAKVDITNQELVGQLDMTAIITSGVTTKVFIGLVGNANGTITLSDKWFVAGVKYSCTIINSVGVTISTVFPIKAV